MKKFIFITSLLFIIFIHSEVQSQTNIPNEVKISNLEAFSRLYGYIRFFHPSDEAQLIDWDKFAVYGMSIAENSANSTELMHNLNELFLPIAPSLKIFPKGALIDFDVSDIVPIDTAGYKKIYWQHSGINLGNKKNIYKSVRVNTQAEIPDNGFGSITQILPSAGLTGKKIKIKAYVKSDVKENEGSGHLWLRVDLTGNKMGFFDNMDSRPIISDQWNEYEISGIVEENAERIVFGCFLQGKGKLWVDEFRFYTEENGKWKEVDINDSGFETNKPGDTQLIWGSSYDNYSMSISETEKYKGKRSLMISRIAGLKMQDKLFYIEPGPSEWITKDINNELTCFFPVSLYADNNGTLPSKDTLYLNRLISLINNTGSEFTGNDKYVRLADVCIAWNIFQHFYPYFEIADTDWNRLLPEYLSRALQDMDGIEFHNVLLELVAQLKDGHGRVIFDKNRKRYFPPFVLDEAEGKIIIAKVTGKADGIEPGDVVIEIDGTEINKKIDELKSKISSATPQWFLSRLLNEELVHGTKGSEIVLKILKNNKEITVKLIRNRLADEIAAAEWYAETRPEAISEIKNGIYYVNLDIAEMNIIDKVFSKLASAKGVIFDLRGYPRGNHDVLRHLTDKPIRSAFFSIPRIIYPDRGKWMDIDTSSRWYMEPLLPRIKGKVVFLTNGNAISYAESVMGIVEAYKLGTIIGQPTAGTNGNVNPFTLPGGYYVTWTGMNVVKHDGSRHHGVGIIPDIIVKRTVNGIKEGRDEFLEIAIEFIENDN